MEEAYFLGKCRKFQVKKTHMHPRPCLHWAGKAIQTNGKNLLRLKSLTLIFHETRCHGSMVPRMAFNLLPLRFAYKLCIPRKQIMMMLILVMVMVMTVMRMMIMMGRDCSPSIKCVIDRKMAGYHQFHTKIKCNTGWYILRRQLVGLVA